MTGRESALQRCRRWAFGTIGMIWVALAAVWYVQPDVPVLYSPEVRWVSQTEIEVAAPYYVTNSVGVVEILPGFRFDGCSIPKQMWSALGLHPLSGASLRAGLLHDACVRGELYGPSVCNLLFREILLADGVEEHKVEAMYKAVVLATKDVWDRHTAASINAAREKVRIRP